MNSSPSKRSRFSCGSVALWTFSVLVVLCAVLVTQEVRQARARKRPFLYLESEPTGARISLDGVDTGLFTPSLTRPDLHDFAKRPFFVELQGEESTARAQLHGFSPTQFGQHTWARWSRHGFSPDLDGALWVERNRNTTRVWLPQSGRVLCGVGLYDFDRAFRLNGEPVPENAWGPASSRRFDITMGLDLAPGRNTLEGALWKATTDLNDRIAVYLDESDNGVVVAVPRLVVTFSGTSLASRTIQLPGQNEQSVAGDKAFSFPTQAATLRFADSIGRENRIDIELRDAIGLWVRVGSAPLR